MMQNEKFYFIQTYGCQMNQSDSGHYARDSWKNWAIARRTNLLWRM